jgi:hypothetical protein
VKRTKLIPVQQVKSRALKALRQPLLPGTLRMTKGGDVPRIVSDGTFSVHVYAQDHAPPHCHVFWAGDKEAMVELAGLTVIAGDALPRAGMALLLTNRDILAAAWQQLNP